MKKKHLKYLLILILVLLVAIAAAIGLFFTTGHKAGEGAEAALRSGGGVKVTETDNSIAFVPDNPVGGFALYPAAKVAPEAYAPLMRECAENGLVTVIFKMPLNLPQLNSSAAETFVETNSFISNWYIGGHSLGGTLAANYVAEHPGEFKGLILLGSYSTKDLSGQDLRIMSICGSNDGILDADKYNANKANLGDCREVVIDGGCHAYFGSYGTQKGDGEPAISREEQTSITARAIKEFVMSR